MPRRNDAELEELTRKANEELLARYRSHRPRVSNDQASEILRLFCHDGLSTQEVALASHTPVETVRAIISYACSLSLDLYAWHADVLDPESRKSKNPPPANAKAYLHFVPIV